MAVSINKRLHVVDALRGFAIVSIMLLHNLEHFDFYFTPDGLPLWMQQLDKTIWDTLFFLFAGKSYAIFALLFGLTYYIQYERQAKAGRDFILRFAWRLLLLLGFGLLNTVFYQGDILGLYAVIGLILIPFRRASNTVLLVVSLVLLFQPVEWMRFFWAAAHPGMVLTDPESWAYFGRMEPYVTGSSFWALALGNLTNGKRAVILWTWENGRVLQTAGLFLLGYYLGRRQVFSFRQASKHFWVRSLTIAAIAFVPLFYLQTSAENMIGYEAMRRPWQTIMASYANLALMGVLVSGFVMLYTMQPFRRTVAFLEPMGKMSLSNYVMQSVFGSSIYYGFGLGLYKHTGATHCLMIGLLLVTFQAWFSAWWMKRHKQGPLETLWHRATWHTWKKEGQVLK